MIKSKQYQSSFEYDIKHIGKGKINNLTWVHEVDSNNKIMKMHTKKEEIEKAIIQHNRKHFTKVHQTKVF